MSPKIQVLFIAGYSRSGSTLLGRLLGAVDRAVFMGELRYVWQRGMKENQLCGCGVPFSECELWTDIIDGVKVQGHLDRVIKLQDSIDRLRYAPTLLRRPDAPAAQEYRGYLWRLFKALKEHTDADVIVDSSKWPSHGLLLNGIPDIDLFVVHLIRDPRAVAHSWRRKKIRPEIIGRPTYMPVCPIWKSALSWQLVNWATEGLKRQAPGKHMTLTYGELTSNPLQSLRRILELVQIDSSTDFLKGHTAQLAATHSVGGNPMRFSSGRLTIRPDEEWRHAMPWTQKIQSLTLSWPYYLRFRRLRDGPLKRGRQSGVQI